MDCRSDGLGIRPVVRRGQYSFLAWYEGGLDQAIAQVDEMYRTQRAYCRWGS